MTKLRKIKRSLKTKVLFYITATHLILGLIAAALAFNVTYNYLVNRVIKDQNQTTEAKSNEIKHIFSSSSSLAKSLSKSLTIKEYLSDKQNETLRANVLLRLNLLNINDAYSAIYLMDSDGLTLVSTDETFVGNNYGFREYFKNAVAGTPYVDMVIGVTSKLPGYYFSHPVEIDGAIQAVVVFKLKPEEISQVIYQDQHGEDETSYLADATGIVICCSDEEILYKSLGQLSTEEINEITEEKRFEGVEINSLRYDEVKEKIQEVRDVTSIRVKHPESQNWKIISIARIGDFPFYFLFEKDTKQIVSESLQNAGAIALSILITMLATMFLINYLITRFLSPLNDVKKFAEEISKENFKYSINVNSGDELEELAEKLKEMSEKIESSYSKMKNSLTQAEIFTKAAVGRELKIKELKEELQSLKKKVK